MNINDSDDDIDIQIKEDKFRSSGPNQYQQASIESPDKRIAYGTAQPLQKVNEDNEIELNDVKFEDNVTSNMS